MNTKALRLLAQFIMLSSFVEIIFRRLARPLTVAPDCCELLECAHIWLHGKTPYVDFIELNFPAIIQIYMLPTACAEFLQLHLMPVFIVFTWLVVVASVLLSFVVLSSKFKSPERDYLLIAISVTAAYISQQDFFGQREFLFAISFIPLFLLRAADSTGKNPHAAIRVVIGVFAAIGLCIKPYFILVPLALELYWLWQKGKGYRFWTIEIATLLSCIGIYALEFYLWPAASKESFFQFILPLSWSGYSFYNAPNSKIYLLSDSYLLAKLCVVGAGAIALWFHRRSFIVVPLFIWMISGYAIAIVQQKGFPYHALPLLTAAVILLVFGLCVLCERSLELVQLKISSLRIIFEKSIVTITVVLAMIPPAMAIKDLLSTNPFVRSIEILQQPMCKSILANSTPTDQILFFDTGGGLQFPTATQLGRHVGSRYVEVFPFAMAWYLKRDAKTSEDKAWAAGAEKRILTEFRTDIEERKPKLVFLPTSSWPLPRDFNLHQYLLASNIFGNAFTSYSDEGPVGGYHMYKRLDAK